MRIQGVDNLIPGQSNLRNQAPAQNAQIIALPELDGPADGSSEHEVKDIIGFRRLEEAVVLANKTMETYGTELRFSIHEDSGEYQVKVIDTRNNSVIREIPPERVLNFVAHVKKMLGIIIDKFI